MIVICEECGKKYRLDPVKIKGKEATGTCTSCKNKIKVYHPDFRLSDTNQPAPLMAEPEFAQEPMNTELDISLPQKTESKKRTRKRGAQSTSKKRRIGLRGKIFSLFFVIPIALIVLAGYLFVDQLNGLSNIISNESTTVVTDIAESIILEKGRDVAKEVKVYLDAHPELKKEEFNTHPEFRSIAMQKVGKTGYTCLVERETKIQPEYMWVHPKTEIIGIDILAGMKKALGDKFKRWDDLRAKDHETKGYYLWLDGKEKYCAGIPIEGTPFNIVSSTYIDEFTQPMMMLEKKAGAITDSTRNTVMAIIAATALLVAIIAFIYGNKLSSKIKNMTDVADRISVGDMDVEITNAGKDELGDLAQAISRMQDSIRLSIERLRRRKQRKAA
jgi:HAMP domain-containing protein